MTTGTISNNGLGANLRCAPGVGNNLITLMPDKTPVILLADAPVYVAPYTWQHIQIDPSVIGNWTITGWVVKSFIAVNPPPLTTRRTIGVHCLQDATAISQQLVAALAPGVQLPSVTVVNGFELARWWSNYARYVVFRNTVTEGLPPIPDDPVAARQAGVNAVNSLLGWIDQLPPNGIPQIENEIQWTPGHNAFWMGVLTTLQSHGRKGIIGAYGVGQPELGQWASMSDALRYAMANGHLVALHRYCAANTPVDQLSADSADFEFRHVELYNAVPADCRPNLIFTEQAHEFSRGKFEGAQPLVWFSDQMQKHDQAYPYIVGGNDWTLGSFGGWSDACIDSAVPALAQFISTGRFP